MIGYVDPASGISGDMFLGCLLDAGWSVESLRQSIEKLPLPAGSWSIEAREVKKGAMRATLADVRASEGHTHRHLSHIREMILGSSLAQAVKDRAVAVFTRLAQAEAHVHGTTPEEVHFHEVGAIDAIIDIVGVCAGLQELGIERLYSGPLPLDGGWGRGDHGPMPLPAPATLELLAAAGAPTCAAPGPGELVTPTGAALLAELAQFSHPAMKLGRIGVGAGQKEMAWPNICRLWVGESGNGGPLVQIETNIDDMNPQLYATVTEQLFAAGAVDVWLAPVQMKKGRPGIVLAVLAPASAECVIADHILHQTTTLGVRVFPVYRYEARREMRSVVTPMGPVQVKLKWVGGELVGVMPEYEDCRRLAESSGAAMKDVWEAALSAGRGIMETSGTGQKPPSVS